MEQHDTFKKLVMAKRRRNFEMAYKLELRRAMSSKLHLNRDLGASSHKTAQAKTVVNVTGGKRQIVDTFSHTGTCTVTKEWMSRCRLAKGMAWMKRI